MNKLKDVTCKNAKPKEKPYKLADGGGMYLEIMPNGSKYWRLKYRYADKEKRLAIGVYPEISLLEAREARQDAKKLLANGVDPSAQKRREKHQTHANAQNTFAAIAREWYEMQEDGWKPAHAHKVWRRIEMHLLPDLGRYPVTEITAQDLLTTLRKVEARGTLDIAKRCHQSATKILTYAISTLRLERNVARDIEGSLKPPKSKSNPYLQESELPDLLVKVSFYSGEVLTKLALQFGLLTFVRSGELRGAMWSEINFEKKEWRIPAERMKMDEQHIVPLCSQSIALLEELKELTGHWPYVFPQTRKPRQVMSDATLTRALHRMGYKDKLTVHGFRATASTILNEHGFDSDVIERQLAHAPRNKIRAAYNHAQYLDKRREMMQWWGDFLDKCLSDKG